MITNKNNNNPIVIIFGYPFSTHLPQGLEKNVKVRNGRSGTPLQHHILPGSGTQVQEPILVTLSSDQILRNRHYIGVYTPSPALFSLSIWRDTGQTHTYYNKIKN